MGSRSELVKTVEKQQQQLDAYEAKLKEIIRAYKGLRVEKEALEASLQALSASQDHEKTASTDHADGDETEQSDDPQSTSATATPELPGRQQQVEVLRNALKTITQEKSRIEAGFTADKKQQLAEQNRLKEELKRREEEAENGRRLLEQQVKELRANLRQTQAERECDTSDHAAVMKELQQKLAQERLRLDHLQRERTNLQRDLERQKEEPWENREKMGELTAELARLKEELREKENNKENGQLQLLQKEIARLKTEYEGDMEGERRRLMKFEAELRRTKEEKERRVEALETRVSELSTILGDYDRQHQQDLAVIEKLKSRCSQLDEENTALARAAATQQDSDSWPQLIDKLRKVADRLRLNSSTPVNFYDLLGLESPENENAHRNCRREYEHLKEEFVKYKLRAQAVLKNKSQAKDGGEESTSETHLRHVIAALQQKSSALEEEMHSCESRHHDTVDGLRATIANLQESREKEVVELKHGYRQKISDVETEMQKQRERTLELLAEKEKELETMRTVIAALRRPLTAAPPPSDPEVGGHKQSSSEESVRSASGLEESESFRLSPVLGEAPIVYYSQELAKKEKELGMLRKEVRQLESAMRDLQHASVTKELRHYGTTETLKEEIRALESKLRLYSEDANLEYLRNVLVRYMMCDNAQGRDHMLKAIGVVLKFSSKDLDMIQRYNSSWLWWNPPTKKQ